MSPQVAAVLSAARTCTPPGWAERETQRTQERVQAEGATPGLGGTGGRVEGRLRHGAPRKHEVGLRTVVPSPTPGSSSSRLGLGVKAAAEGVLGLRR